MNGEVDGSPAASVGRRGLLQLEFDMEQRTVLSRQFAEAPFHVQRAVYCEEMLPEMAYLYIMSMAGGILGGDSHQMDITLGANTMVHLTTQGATRIYDTGSDVARQVAHITLGQGSYLEFVPDQIIPYSNSRYLQDTRMVVDDSATLVYSEILASGRLAMGESFQYNTCSLRTEATNQSDIVRFVDAARIEPDSRNPAEYGIMGEYTVSGTAYVLVPALHVSRLYEEIDTIVSVRNGRTVGGASVMPRNTGVLARILGHNAGDIREIILHIASLVRRQILDAPFSDIRKS